MKHLNLDKTKLKKLNLTQHLIINKSKYVEIKLSVSTKTNFSFKENNNSRHFTHLKTDYVVALGNTL